MEVEAWIQLDVFLLSGQGAFADSSARSGSCRSCFCRFLAPGLGSFLSPYHHGRHPSLNPPPSRPVPSSSLILRHNPGNLSLHPLPHLSISALLVTAGVPLTTTLRWLRLMRNLPSSHLLDVHQRDRDRQSVSLTAFTDGVWLLSLSFKGWADR